MKTKKLVFKALALSLIVILCCPAGVAAAFDGGHAVNYLEYPDAAVTEFLPAMLGRISSGDD